MTEPGLDFLHHSLDVAIGAHADHLAVAGPGITPVVDLDGHAAHAPFIHESAGGFVQVDGIDPGEGKAVVVNLIEFTCGSNAEDGAAGPACPIGSGAINGPVFQGRAESGEGLVAVMIAFALGVGGGADFLHGGAAHGSLVAWKRMRTPPQIEHREEK